MPAGRLIIYSAAFGVLVGSVDDSTRVFLKLVESVGGHLQSQQDTAVTVRVPAERFQTVVDKIGELGAIISRTITADDVTRAVRELQLRIDNAEKTRARLLELLGRAQKMEEILEIEKELRRLTEEIELMKSQMRSYEDRIAFSTITVQFHSNAPEAFSPARRRHSPFNWINQVGAEHVLPN